MRLTDLLILYFSFGAPVLVAYIVTKRCGRFPGSAAYAAAVLALWPVFAALLLFQKYGRKLDSLGTAHGPSNIYTRERERIDIIRNEIEKVISREHSASELYRWRSDLDRYVSICLELSEAPDSAPDFEIYRVVQHPDADIANACHQRRVLAKLVSQQEWARAELIARTLSLCSGSDARLDAEQLLLSLALLLNDRDGEDDVRDLFGQFDAAANVSDIGSEVWQPQI